MKYIYGPVKSRRLGLSLGISLTNHKICNFDCIYCQLGKTEELSWERKAYIEPSDILDELRSWIQNNPGGPEKLSYITLSGSGEPTLNIKIGEIIKEIRKLTASPIAVITNSSLLADANIRRQIEDADLIVPSLDSVVPEAFQKIDRPHQNIQLDKIIEGLIALRKEFKGKIWLEVMLVKGLNDDIRQIKKLKEVIEKINPDKIQLNSPVRTHNPQAVAVDKAKLEKIKEILGEKTQIV